MNYSKKQKRLIQIVGIGTIALIVLGMLAPIVASNM